MFPFQALIFVQEIDQASHIDAICLYCTYQSVQERATEKIVFVQFVHFQNSFLFPLNGLSVKKLTYNLNNTNLSGVFKMARSLSAGCARACA